MYGRTGLKYFKIPCWDDHFNSWPCHGLILSFGVETTKHLESSGPDVRDTIWKSWNDNCTKVRMVVAQNWWVPPKIIKYSRNYGKMARLNGQAWSNLIFVGVTFDFFEPWPMARCLFEEWHHSLRGCRGLVSFMKYSLVTQNQAQIVASGWLLASTIFEQRGETLARFHCEWTVEPQFDIQNDSHIGSTRKKRSTSQFVKLSGVNSHIFFAKIPHLHEILPRRATFAATKNGSPQIANILSAGKDCFRWGVSGMVGEELSHEFMVGWC